MNDRERMTRLCVAGPRALDREGCVLLGGDADGRMGVSRKTIHRMVRNGQPRTVEICGRQRILCDSTCQAVWNGGVLTSVKGGRPS